ncbi:urease subunit gamma [Streptomyces sp. EN27]|uniref:urease subunit gamma n=1 Tax=Streptomyces sp. EN27 TaxID=211464 RepID=UPI0035227377
MGPGTDVLGKGERRDVAVHLTPHEQERLMLHVAADVAEKRRSRGVRLNYPEAMALLIVHVLEGARDGRTVADLMSSGRKVLSREEVMEGVPEMIENVQVEATFPDGTKLVTVHSPFPEAGGDEVPAVWPGKVDFSTCEGDEVVVFNEHNRQEGQVTKVTVDNPTDRPVQVGSHYHFAEVNDGLEFPRMEAWGRRLNVPAGSSVRFEPGITEEVELVPIEGERVVHGLRGRIKGLPEKIGGSLDNTRGASGKEKV